MPILVVRGGRRDQEEGQGALCELGWIKTFRFLNY